MWWFLPFLFGCLQFLNTVVVVVVVVVVVGGGGGGVVVVAGGGGGVAGGVVVVVVAAVSAVLRMHDSRATTFGSRCFRFVFRLQGPFLYRSSHVGSAFSTDRRVNRGLSRLGLCGRFSEGLKTALGTEDWLLQDICPLDDDHRLIGYQTFVRQVVHLVILEFQPPHTKTGSGHHGGLSLG